MTGHPSLPHGHLWLPPPHLLNLFTWRPLPQTLWTPTPLNWTCWKAGGWPSTEKPSCSCCCTHFLGSSSTLFPSRVLRSLGCPSQFPHIPSSSSPNVPGTRIVAIDVSPVPSNPTCKRGDKNKQILKTDYQRSLQDSRPKRRMDLTKDFYFLNLIFKSTGHVKS